MNPKARITVEEIARRLDIGRLAVYRDLLAWWQLRLTGDIRKRDEFPALAATNRGPHALAEQAGVIVKTIHSAKGGQAEVVNLSPDLSAPRDSVIQQFYVGVTRAREKLYICGRESSLAIRL